MSVYPKGCLKQCGALLKLAILLVLVLFTATVVLLWVRWQDLVQAINRPQAFQATVAPEAVRVEYTLPLLAGTPTHRLVREAIQAQSWETAHLLLTWDLDTPPATRVSLWRTLIQAHAGDEAMRRTEARLLHHLAVLHPHLNDGARLEALLYLLPQWQAWGEEDGFQATAQSLAALATSSPAFRPEQRQRALSALRKAGFQPRSSLPTVATGFPTVPPVFQVPLPPPALPSDVYQAQEARREAAQALLEAPNDTTRQRRLAEALRAENLAREAFYDHALAATPTPDEQVILAWDQVRWRTLRLMVARRVFGISLIPEWEERWGELELAQIKAWERFVAYAGDWMAAQPDIARADQGFYELWAWVAWAGESGLYPRYPQWQVWQALSKSQERYFAHPSTPWRPWIDLVNDREPRWYVLTKPPE